jgi:hypothetical protein
MKFSITDVLFRFIFIVRSASPHVTRNVVEYIKKGQRKLHKEEQQDLHLRCDELDPISYYDLNLIYKE